MFKIKKDIDNMFFLATNERNQWKLSFENKIDVKLFYQIIFASFIHYFSLMGELYARYLSISFL